MEDERSDREETDSEDEEEEETEKEKRAPMKNGPVQNGHSPLNNNHHRKTQWTRGGTEPPHQPHVHADQTNILQSEVFDGLPRTHTSFAHLWDATFGQAVLLWKPRDQDNLKHQVFKTLLTESFKLLGLLLAPKRSLSSLCRIDFVPSKVTFYVSVLGITHIK